MIITPNFSCEYAPQHARALTSTQRMITKQTTADWLAASSKQKFVSSMSYYTLAEPTPWLSASTITNFTSVSLLYRSTQTLRYICPSLSVMKFSSFFMRKLILGTIRTRAFDFAKGFNFKTARTRIRLLFGCDRQTTLLARRETKYLPPAEFEK